ncbi:hypothetical protein IMG5_002010, partial [Ichthyophthirius multifiliis]
QKQMNTRYNFVNTYSPPPSHMIRRPFNYQLPPHYHNHKHYKNQVNSYNNINTFSENQYSNPQQIGFDPTRNYQNYRVPDNWKNHNTQF